MAVDVGSAVGYLDLDISGFLAGLKSADTEADKSSKGIGSKISGMGKSMSSVGSTLTKNVTLPLAGIGVAGLKVATDFEKGMSEVKAISGATGKEFDALREKAIELGADTAFSSGEVAEAMTEMAKAGWDSQQIIDGMSGVLAAAAASGEGLASVSTIVADAITGFGLAASDSTKVADLLTQAANSGTIGITDLGETFKYIAPVAGAMGLSIEDVTTAVSAMSMAGIKGSQAGTSLRTMLTNLVNPSDKMETAMKKLGISATNADGSMKSLDEIVANLRTSFDGLTEAEKAQYAAILAGKTGMSGMLALLNLTEEEYNAIAASMDNAGGVAEETAAIMQDNLQSKVEQLGGALESLAIKMADYVLPALQRFVVWVTSLIDKFTNLSPSAQKAILVIGGIAAAIGPVLLTIGKLTAGIGNTITAFGKIKDGVGKAKSAMKTFSAAQTAQAAKTKIVTAAQAAFNAVMNANPVFLVITAIVALVAIFVVLWNKCEGFRNFFISIWESIKVAFQAFMDFISPAIETIKGFFVSLWEKLQVIWEGIKTSLQPLIDEIIGAFQMAWDAIKLVWDYVQPFFENIWIGIQTIFSVVGEILGGFFSAAWELIKGVWDVAVSYFKLIWENIKAVFSVVGAVISGFFSVAWEAIKAIWNTVVAYFTMIWAGIKAVFAVVKAVLSGNFSEAWEAIKNLWGTVVNFFSTVWEGIKNVFGSVVEWFSNIFSTAWEAIKSVFSNFGSFFGGLWNTIKNTFSKLGTSIASAIGGAVKSGINGVISMIENTINGAIGLINGAINLINKIPGVSIGHLGDLKLPRLAKGGIVTAATVAMIGEDGTEAVVPLEKNLGWMKKLADEFIQRLSNFFITDIHLEESFARMNETLSAILNLGRQLATGGPGYVSYSGFTKGGKPSPHSPSSNPETDGGGDTYIFNSPEPIDEIEAAKQMKKAKRDLAEGF